MDALLDEVIFLALGSVEFAAVPSFLQTAFLSGLAALAVPILIHLFFRLKTKRVELGTIRFLRTVLEENARRRKVLRWLLLALRMAFVALLAGMFARPYFTAAATGTDKELLVILIDQSATMQLKGENGRLIDQAIAEARRLIETAGNNSRVEVALFNHEVHPVTDAKSDRGIRGNEIVARLQAPTSLFGATNYGSAFRWARDICVKGTSGARQLHLFTDLQQSGLDWTDVEPLPSDVKAHLHDLGRPVVNNVAVTEIRTPRLWIRPGESPTVHASVSHGGSFALEEVSVLLEIGRIDEGQRPAQGNPATNGGELRIGSSKGTSATRTDYSKLAERITKRERVKLEPGASVTLNFELPPLSEGLWQGRITVEYDDDLAFDNQRYFAISATPAYRVLIVSGDDQGASLTGEAYFLDAALRLASPGDVYDASPFAPTVVSQADGTSLPPLSDFHAIALVNVADVSRVDAEQLALFVSRGGGLVVFTGDHVTAKSQSALADVKLTVGDIGETRITNDLPWRMTQWETQHPVFQPLSDPQHGDLRRLIFAAYTKVTPAPEATVLARFNTDDPAVVERRVGAGTVLWVNTSCGRDWSDWCRSRLFLPMVHQLVGYEVGLTSGGRVRTRLIDSARDIELSGRPAEVGETAKGDMMATVSTTPSSLQLTTASSSKGDLRDSSFPGVEHHAGYSDVINTSPRESDMDRCGRSEFEERFAVKFVDEEGASGGSSEIANVELQRDEKWHWVGCLLLVILLLEGFVGNRTTA